MAGDAAAADGREFWPWLGHHAWRLQFVVFAGWIASLFVPPGPSLFILAVTIPAYIVLYVAEYRHDRRLCDACIAGWPLDPQAEVTRRRRWLLMEHRWAGADRRRAWFWALVALAIAIGLLVLTITTGLRWPQVVMQTAIYVFFAFAGYSRHVHKRLQPWCPWCHRGDGDDHFHPEPVTPPSVRADR